MTKQELGSSITNVDWSDFTNVDRTLEPNFFVHYLNAISGIKEVQAYKRWILSCLDVQESFHILDVGCGLGDDVQTLAQMVGKTGHVIGVDSSGIMIAEAQKRIEGIDLPMEYYLGDAHNLNFASCTFDICRADRTFLHLEDPRKALSEMIRVARPGSQIVISEPDWETLVINANDRILTRKIVNFLCDSIRNGWIGRQLPTLFKELGLVDVTVATYTLMLTDYVIADRLWELRGTAKRAQDAGVIAASQTASWLRHLEESNQIGHFFCALTGFSVKGRKP
jgi:ubiquinone/menaquinone biosynthesis C-methylase UbiE